MSDVQLETLKRLLAQPGMGEALQALLGDEQEEVVLVKIDPRDKDLWEDVRRVSLGIDTSDEAKLKAHESATELARRHPDLSGADHYSGAKQTVGEIELQAEGEVLAEEKKK